MKQENHPLLIYIVDDEKVVAESLAAILRRSGFRTTPFSDPRLALYRAQEDPPQLLLANLFMAALSGVDLAITMSKAAPDCRVLLFSDSSQAPTFVDRTRQQGYCFEFLRKPIRPSELLTTCNRLAKLRMEPFVCPIFPGVPFS